MAESRTGSPAARGTSRNRGTVAWVVALSIACFTAVASAQQHGACKRCGKFVLLSDKGFGFMRHWKGLCGACQDPGMRCGEAVRDLESRIEQLRDELGWFRRELAALQNGTPSPLANLKIRMLETQVIPETERMLAEMQRRLETMRAECSGGGGSGGSSAGGDNPWRTLADSLGRVTWQVLGESDKLVNNDDIPIREVGVVVGGYRFVKALVDAQTQPGPSASGNQATAAEPHAAPATSQEELIDPSFVEVEADLPTEPVARDFARAKRHAANAAACADALRKSVDQVDAAKEAGNADRAHQHLDRAVYLATAGQQEARQALASRTEGVRKLYRESKDFEERAKASGKTVEQAIESWQATVRADGLPPAYVTELQKAGVSDAKIAKWRE